MPRTANRRKSLRYDPYTKLLLHFDGADDGTVFSDSSNRKHTVTRTNAVTKTGTKKFGTSAGYFDGDGDYLSLADSDDWNFGTGNWTIDFWFRPAALTTSQRLCGQFVSNDNRLLCWLQADNILHFLAYSGAVDVGDFETSSVAPLTLNTWSHIAFVRSGSTPYIFVDGISQSLTISQAFGTLPNVAAAFMIGQYGTNTNYVNGYIDEFRVSKGIARWTSNFNPPTAPYENFNLYNADPYTKLLLHMDGEDNGTNFNDSSSSPKLVTRTNALTKTGTKKMGTASGYFDGTGDYLSLADSADWNFGSGDFTIDCWMNPIALAEECFFDQYVDNDNRIRIYLDGTNFDIKAWNSSVKIVELVAAHGVSTGSWWHLAVVRYGNTLTAYVNGASVGTDDLTGITLPDYGATVLIGADRYNGGLNAYSTCYIDELRISKGIARWTANFTPPTSQYSR